MSRRSGMAASGLRECERRDGDETLTKAVIDAPLTWTRLALPKWRYLAAGMSNLTPMYVVTLPPETERESRD